MAKRAPGSLHYNIPPEWHPHSATLLHWPHNRESWPGSRLERVEKVYCDIIEILHKYEPIHLVVTDERIRKRAWRYLSETEITPDKIILHQQPINDVWARDCGPIFIRKQVNGKGTYAITDWEYNAWGGKYPPFDDDNRIPEYFAKKYGFKRFHPGIVLEGGSIETNGTGVLLTTESVLLNPNRNPGLGKGEIEQVLRDYLGIEKIIWLKKGLEGDDTDGHIDDLSRFINEETILTMIAGKPDDVNYEVLQNNLMILEKATDVNGNSFKIETLPLPQTRIEGTTVDGSEHVPASYANFYIANGAVLVPLYDHSYDQLALDFFKHYFPERDIHGIPCADLVWGQGSIHCITQQLYGM